MSEPEILRDILKREVDRLKSGRAEKPLHDKNMRPIKVGDVLRHPHFRGKRGKLYFMHHVVCDRPEEGGIVAIPVSELATRTSDGGRVRAVNRRWFEQSEIIGGVSLEDYTMFDERKRVDE